MSWVSPFPPISYENELAKEFGGTWTAVPDSDEAFRASFDNTGYANQLGNWLKQHRCPYELEPDGDGKIMITIKQANGTLECADMFCGKFRKPENAHVTVQSVLNRVNPEQGVSRGKKS